MPSYILVTVWHNLGRSVPKYTLLQSAHVSLYTPDRECVSEVCSLCINIFCMVLIVLNSNLLSFFFNRLVMDAISLPAYVNVAHFYVGDLWVQSLFVL